MTQQDLKELFDESGNLISPTLPEGVKNYLIDIDGTVTEDVPNETPERMVTCEPFPDALAIINKWHDEGHIITFFTSRLEEHRAVTDTWLQGSGFKYHALLMNKPRGGNYHWIDNHIVRGTRYNGKFTELVKRERTVEVFDDEES
jgi:hypothetical protein